jgi:transposase
VLKREKLERDVVELVNTDLLVPSDHLLRKIDGAVDFTHIYDFVEDLYCADNGRPSADPVVLIKMALIQHLYGIRSLRQTVKDIEMNIAYRWFLGYTLNETIPHFATVSYNFRHRFKESVIEDIFTWILYEVERAGYLKPEVVFVDATHIKANANLKKRIKKAIPGAARTYEDQLLEEVNADREDHGKKPFDDTKPPEDRNVTESTTDPDCGVFNKGEHKKCFAYGAHTVCDQNNFVRDVVVTAGNHHDSQIFDALYKKVTGRYPQIQVITADAGYKRHGSARQILMTAEFLQCHTNAP